MTGGNIASLDTERAGAESAAATLAGEPLGFSAITPDADEAVAAPRLGWLALALVALAAWTAFFAWSHADAATDPANVADLIARWAAPAALIGVAWLLARRHSAREARRFGVAGAALGEAAARLENRLFAVNRELSVAREFLTAEARDLETLGRLATERIGGCAGELQQLVAVNGERIDAIGGVSRLALVIMERLRAQLPVIASSAKDVTNYIGSAGRAALEHTEELHGALRRIGDAGAASEQQVRTLRASVDAGLAEFAARCEQFDTIAGARFAALAEGGDALRAELDSRETEALAAIRARAGALGDELEQARGRQRADEDAALDALRARIAALRDEGDAAAGALREGETRALNTWRAAVARLDEELRAALVLADNAGRDAADASRDRLGRLSDEVDRFDAALAARGRTYAELAGGEGAARLRAEIAAIDGMAAALEARVAAARARAEEPADHGFARRAAEITESLNARAMDLSSALAADVSDTAWRAYLGGDRGVFSRRAVKLLGGRERREIAALCDADPGFGEHVARYIGDFEAMLRRMLGVEGGDALAVTLLSSDLGKLYVALAQATERLRG